MWEATTALVKYQKPGFLTTDRGNTILWLRVRRRRRWEIGMFLTEKYPECMVEYRVIMDDGFVTGIECVGENVGGGILGEIEKRVDIQRAKAEGCRGAREICSWLNGER